MLHTYDSHVGLKVRMARSVSQFSQAFYLLNTLTYPCSCCRKSWKLWKRRAGGSRTSQWASSSIVAGIRTRNRAEEVDPKQCRCS